MEKTVSIRTSKPFYDALDEIRFTLKRNIASLVREAIQEYADRHLPKEAKAKVDKLFAESPEIKDERE